MPRLNQAEQAEALDAFEASRARETAVRANTWTAARVEAALAEAGKALLSMPPNHEYPAAFRTAWPEILRVIREGDRALDSMARPALPSAQEIAAMQYRMMWITRFLESRPLRRIVCMRMLVHPLSETPLRSWRDIAAVFGRSPTTAQAWHTKACGLIAKGLNAQGEPVRVPLARARQRPILRARIIA